MSAQHSPDRSRRGARREHSDDGEPVLVGEERQSDLSCEPVIYVSGCTADSRAESLRLGAGKRLFDVIRDVLPSRGGTDTG